MTTALHFFDHLQADRGQRLSGSLAGVADRLLEVSLEDYRRIELLEQMLADDLIEAEGRILIRTMLREWADAADSLLIRVNRLESEAGRMEASDQLEATLGRTRAMLSIPLERLAESEVQADEGQVKSLEEVRSELRARNHP